MSEWKEVLVEDACSYLSSGKSISSTLIKEAAKYPVYGGNGIRGFTDSYNFEGECAIIGRQGASCGNVRYFSGKAYMTEHAVVAVPTEKHNAYYLSCVLASLKLGRLSGQSAQPGIGVGLIGRQSITMPLLATQKNIASILTSFDSKIECNRKICANLEAQAQALFKHWFVDFAPFKDGKFVESELGLIPEGWRVGTLGDIADLRKPSIKPQDNILYTHYSIPAFDNCKKPSVDEGSTIKSNKFGINDGAVLLSKLNPSTKRIWYTGKVPEHSVSSTEFLPFYSHNKEFTPFIYCYLYCDSNYREIANGAKGTTNSHQRIDANSILNRALAYSEEAIREFCDCCKYLMELILEANQESSRLSTLRDTLLPKLMSGQISVNEYTREPTPCVLGFGRDKANSSLIYSIRAQN